MPNHPRTLRGAFVEYGLSVPPLVVTFQFNPEELSRSRSLSFAAESQSGTSPTQDEDGRVQGTQQTSQTRGLREFHQMEPPGDSPLPPLEYIRRHQKVTVQEESLSFDIRLDATDKLNEGDPITEQFGIAPQLATLELMTLPKGESILGEVADEILGLGGEEGFSFTEHSNPPMILFIWGRKRVLPVNIDSMNVTESQFSADLNPTRATVSVNLTVIEGPNVPYLRTKTLTETMSGLNLTNIADVQNVMIPG